MLIRLCYYLYCWLNSRATMLPHSVFLRFIQNGEVGRHRNIPALDRLLKRGLCKFGGYLVSEHQSEFGYSVKPPTNYFLSYDLSHIIQSKNKG